MMTSLWIFFAVGAAIAQSVRTAAQKQLNAHVDVLTVTASRYFFGFPLALIYLGILILADFADASKLQFAPSYFAYCIAAAVAQIAATIFLIQLFSLRNFAVGTTYARSETVLTAIIGAIFFAEAISGVGWLAICITSSGIIVITVAKAGWRSLNPFVPGGGQSAVIGLTSGTFFAVCSLWIRSAALSLGDGGFLLNAAVTLNIIIAMQVTMLFGYLFIRRREQLRRLAAKWRLASFIGVTSFMGSLGWFTAFALERAAYVKAVGQIEVLFTIAISIYYFKERSTRFELIGIAMTIGGIFILVLN
jgi:drug/metabolite transporter (DMT)-like permease